MIYKAIGTLLLLLAGGYVSVFISHFERQRLRVLDGYIALIGYIKGQIDCYSLPLPDILARADRRLLMDCLGLHSMEQGERTISDCVYRTAAPLPAMVEESRTYLEPETLRLLTTFSGELGSTYRAQQVARCDYYIGALTEERNKLFAALPARVRVSSVLSICSALGAAVLLW